MALSFTNIALGFVAMIGLVGLWRGARAFIVFTGSVVFSFMLVYFAGDNVVGALNRLGMSIVSVASLSLAHTLIFLVSIILVQVGAQGLVRRFFRDGGGRIPREARIWGGVLGVLDGFLIVGVAVYYASVYLSSVSPTGGAGWQVPIVTVQFAHPITSTFTISFITQNLLITPSPLLDMYNRVPVAMTVLFIVLVIVFIGTVYRRVDQPQR